MNPLISIIIPVYKVEKYLDRCVESVVNQTYQNLEIILVDDGSPDNCPKMCDVWSEKDDRIKVVHKVNGGLSSARNAGIDCHTGEYISFIDSDDTVDKCFIEKMLIAIKSGDYSVSVCNFLQVNSKNEIIGETDYPEKIYNGDLAFKSYLRFELVGASACNKLYRSYDIDKIDLRFDELIKWGEDHRFNYYFFKEALGAITIKDSLYHYSHNREGSITYSVTEQSVNRWELTKYILEHEKDNKENYFIVLSVFASEILCCLRELLKSHNDELLNRCYLPICNEIKNYSKQFLALKDLKVINRISILIIKASPRLFRTLYLLIKGIN